MNLRKRWRGYWFQRTPLIYLAVCRVVFVAFQLLQLSLLDRRGEFARLSALPGELYHPLPILRLLTLPVEWATVGAVHWRAWQFQPSASVLEWVYWVTYLAGVLALIGFKTNPSLFVFATGSIFLQAFFYSFKDFHHPEAMLMIALAVLAFSPAGRVLSIDDLRRRLAFSLKRQKFVDFHLAQRRSALAWWPLLLIQWTFALVYFSAALSKLKGGGIDWANGYTLQYYLLQDGVRWGSALGVWLSGQHTLVWLASWMSLIFEGTFFLVVLVPVLAWIYIPAGIAFHTGVYATMRAPFFHYFPLYLVFIPWLPAGSAILRWLGLAKSDKKPEILFDGQCPLCIRSMTVLRYFDWFDCLTLRDLEQHGSSLRPNSGKVALQDLRREMHLITPDGAVRQGFFAFREALKYLPLLWPVLALLYVPFATMFGPKVYGFVAARRARWQQCDFDTCAVHSVRQ